MREEIAFQNGRISDISWARDLNLDLGSGHTAYRHASLAGLYLQYQMSLKSKKNFLWTDGRTYGRTDGRTDI